MGDRMDNSAVIPFPTDKAPTVGMFPTYYDAVYDEVTIPRLPSDPDTAAAIIGAWGQLLVAYKILTPKEAINAARKGAGEGGKET